MWQQLREQSAVDLHIEDFPQLFRRYVTAEEIAAMVGFLLADESKFITRTALPIDGGLTG